MSADDAGPLSSHADSHFGAKLCQICFNAPTEVNRVSTRIHNHAYQCETLRKRSLWSRLGRSPPKTRNVTNESPEKYWKYASAPFWFALGSPQALSLLFGLALTLLALYAQHNQYTHSAPSIQFRCCPGLPEVINLRADMFEI